MATWFTVIGRVAQIEGIVNSRYKNALIEFEEGDMELSSCRSFYVAFWGDLLESGGSYVILGPGRLTSNEDCSQPKFTATYAIPFTFEALPVHYVQINVAVDLKTAPKLEAAGKTYTFEGAISGYYSHRNDRLQRSLSTHITTQYFYADVSPRLERILGSTNMQPSTKLFIDGDYRFPVEGDSTPGYIEVRDVTFNMTNRSAQGGAPTDGTRASGGTAGNRRNVALKSSPAKPKHTGASSRAGPASAVPEEDVGLHTTAADGSEAEMSFSLAEFGNVSDLGAPAPQANSQKVQNKRGNDSSGRPETPKRQRRPGAMA